MATYQSILDASIALLCEDASNGDCEDYKTRAIYILATFSTECQSLDRRLRKSLGDNTDIGKIPAVVILSDNFPLSDAFIPAATYYLSAILAIEENEALSEKFFELYTDAIASIQASLPTTAETVVNRYVGTL